MPSKKKKTVKFSEILDKGLDNVVADLQDAAPDDAPPPPKFRPLPRSSVTAFFPLARYTSIVGVQTSLLLFTALFLPRTPLPDVLASLAPPPALRNADRAEHPFVTGLTLHPLATLAWLAAGALLVQGWWAGWLREWAREYDGRLESDEQRMARRDESWNYRKMADLKEAWMSTAAGTLVFHIVLVLFGAPLAGQAPHTFFLALLLSLLTVLPAAYALGAPTSLVKRLAWVRLFAELSPRTPIERSLVHPAVGCVLGAWVGAIPLALDWERSWQAYPLPLTYLALTGYVLGSFVALVANSIEFLADQGKDREARAKRD